MKDSLLLSVENLKIAFQNEQGISPTIKDISFELQHGKTLAIVGESGSGKSVTVMNILQLLPQPPAIIQGGRVIYDQQDLMAASPDEIRSIRGGRISVIFQEPMTSLNPVYTCGDQVIEIVREHTNKNNVEAKKSVIELFEKVKLPRADKIFDSYPHQLSGGQKQRVVIAMALICNPEIIIADEPTTALDVTVQKEILVLLKSLQEEYKTGLIFITHDLGVVKDIADEVIVMYQGSIVEKGFVEEIFQRPQHPYTKGLINCRPPINVRPKRLLSIDDFLQNENPHTTNETKEERENRHKTIYANPPILRIKDLSKIYVDTKGGLRRNTTLVKAVDGITFDVFQGETLGLVGESGCGKTTLSRTILGLIKPTNGTIIYKGQHLENLNEKKFRPLRKDLQIIFQDPYSSLNPKLKIGDAILEPMKIHGLFQNDKERTEKVIELLEKTGLSSDHYNRYPHEFSGGQRQRIVIARTLSLNPKLIICDEVVSALDVSVQAQVLNLMNDLKNELGLTYIFISHDLSVVKYMSDRIMVMNRGRIEEITESNQLFQSPKSAYSSSLINSIPGVNG